MKKQFFNVVVFASIFAMSSLVVADGAGNQNGLAAPLVDDSGKDRIVNIMSQIKHDVVPRTAETIDYAQTSNIDQDLNIKAIADFFGCKTVMGSAFLKETLQRPVSSIDKSGIVALRTNAVKALVENPQLKAQVEAMLQNAAEQEKDVVELMSNSFRGQTCPELENLEVIKKQNPVMYPAVNFLVRNRAWKTYDFVSNSILVPMLLSTTAGFGYLACDDELRDIISPGLTSGRATVWATYIGLVAAMLTYQYVDGLIKAGQKRVKMHALNQLIYVADSIEKISYENSFVTQFKMSLIKDEVGIAIIDALKASRYENETDYCFDVPAVHTFLFSVYENENQLAQIFASIAEMDAYNAIATKILESQNSQRTFCFADKIESTQPQVVSTSFWNVLVPNAVVNSLAMNQHMILTGPNAGGKTTSIRANLQNIILAQTYGIAAAEQFSCTQFDVILSYLNISDDLINGLSLFASEVKRAKDLLEIIKDLGSDQKLFFALDELFTGTAAEQGGKCAYEFIKKTSTYQRILFVYATHFDQLKELGKQNIGLMNYKVDAPIKNRDGKLVYPFTLSPGASTINVAEDMAKEAGLFE
jgi:MutS domain V